MQILAETGVDGLSLRAVARRASVSAMAPYRHYADKEALLAAVATKGFEGLRLALHTADAAAGPGDELVAQAVAYVRYAYEHPALFRLMFGPSRLCQHPELNAAGDTAYQVLEARVTAGTAPESRDERVLGCWALVHGLASLFLDGRIKEDAGSIDTLTRRVAENILNRKSSNGDK